MLIHGYASAKNLKEAERLLHGLENSGLRPDTVTFNTLISMYIKSGQRIQVGHKFITYLHISMSIILVSTRKELLKPGLSQTSGHFWHE